MPLFLSWASYRMLLPCSLFFLLLAIFIFANEYCLLVTKLVGCTDGANDYAELLLDWAAEYGLSVLIDVHGMKGSQNGFDNSGQSMGMQWTSSVNVYPRGLTTFQHWPIRNAGWMGKFDVSTLKYSEINREQIQHSLDVLKRITQLYSGHPAVLGLQPVNEPWEHTPIEELKDFYWQGYLIMKRYAPYWKYIMHDSFRFDTNIWGGFMNGCPDRAIDTHIYQAWQDPQSRLSFFSDACAQKSKIATMEREFGPVLVGEWSLATDNCAMWLNGFNDNLPGFPRLPCKYVACADPYMGFDQPGTPVDPSKALQGPYGTGMSGPVWGMCPVGRDWVKERKKAAPNDWIHAPPSAPKHLDDTDFVMSQLALKKINAFSGVGHGFYFWNFRTELDEPHWSYMQALERGWIPKGNLNAAIVSNACRREDNGMFECVCKRNQLESTVRGTIKYCLNGEGILGDDQNYVDNLQGDDLYNEADIVFNRYWSAHRVDGATCDFGGIATLKEINATDTDEIDDDFFYYYGVEENMAGLVLKIFWAVIGGITVGGIMGFFIAMRVSKKFNASVSRVLSRTDMGRALQGSRVFSGTFHPMDLNYDEIKDAEPNAWAQLTPSHPKA